MVEKSGSSLVVKKQRKVSKSKKDEEEGRLTIVWVDANDIEMMEKKEVESDDMQEEVTVSQLLNYFGFGKFQYFLLFSFGLCYIADAFELLVVSFLLPLFRVQFGMSSVMESR